MPKLVSFMMTSLDGYFESPDRSIAWANLADDFHEHSISQLNDIGTLLFGRVTYEGMVAYWTNAEAAEQLPAVARRMNDLPKVVFSSTLDSVHWSGTTLVRGPAADAVADLKDGGGSGELAIFGSSALTAHLLDAGLVDEVRLIVQPTLLGQGHTVFGGLTRAVDLHLLRTTAFASGNLLACYQPTPRPAAA